MKPYLKPSIWIVIITIVFTNCSTQTAYLPDDVTQNIQQRIEYGLNGAIAIGIIDQDGIRYYNFGSRDSSGAIKSSTSDMIKYISAQLEFTETSLSKAFELINRCVSLEKYE